MKTKLILFAAVAAFNFSSCTKNLYPDELLDRQGASLLTVTLDSGLGTKVSGDQGTNDKTIQNAQVFIFNTRTKQIDNAVYKDFTSTTGSCTMPDIQCTFGEKEIWAIVNAPKDYVSGKVIKTIDDLKKTTVVLSDNKASALVMTGSMSKSLAAATETVTVNVERLVAAVVLKSVRNEMAVPAYRDKLTITGAYLMNVPSIQSLDGAILASSAESATSNWSAFYGKSTATGVADLLTESISETSVPYEQAHNALHTFYTFSSNFERVEGKNNKTDKSSVYLVVECKVDGVACVYPVLMPKLERNNRYEVSLTVKHVGGNPENPWEKINFATFKPSINIVGWDDVSVTEVI